MCLNSGENEVGYITFIQKGAGFRLFTYSTGTIDQKLKRNILTSEIKSAINITRAPYRSMVDTPADRLVGAIPSI